jgi:hypothetical protein
MLRRAVHRTLRSFVVAVALAGAGACSQAEGDACQVDRDCEDGLICNRNALGSDRGECVVPGSDTGGGGAGGGSDAMDEDAGAMSSGGTGDADGG